MFQLQNRVVLVTGAVGNLGYVVARVFQRLEARTILLDRSTDRLRMAFPDIADSANHFLAGEVDLSSADSVQRVVQTTIERFGRIDALVNTVGGFRGGIGVLDQSDEDWDFLLGVNLRTTLNACRAVIPVMLKQKSGRIINIASRAGLSGEAGFSAYSASKAAVIRLTESISAEFRHAGVSANCVLPGTIDTPQNRAAAPRANVSDRVAPEDIANVVAFLASDASRAITGAAIQVLGQGSS